MLEFEPNTLAFMTAAPEQCAKRLVKDTPDARKFIADKLKACARRGRAGQRALYEAGEEALAELNGNASREKSGGLASLVQWMI